MAPAGCRMPTAVEIAYYETLSQHERLLAPARASLRSLLRSPTAESPHDYYSRRETRVRV
jgi:hypothetical protein